jgi:hypothetical protein
MANGSVDMGVDGGNAALATAIGAGIIVRVDLVFQLTPPHARHV